MNSRNSIFSGKFWKEMAEQIKDAWKGKGDGLQSASTAVGNVIAEQTQAGGQKKADAANESLMGMGSGSEKSGPTVEGTYVDAARQSANQETGVADHLGMGG